MKRMTLTVEQRFDTGKGPARRLRAQGKAPAVIYGRKMEPLKLAVDVHEFTKILDQSGSNVLFDLSITGGDGPPVSRRARLKERQVKPVDGDIVHIDFQEVLMDEAIEVTVPLQFEGKPEGVEKGGMFQPAARELRVACLPDDIPGVITVDVSGLDLGESLHISDITLPKGVSLAQDGSLALATILAPEKEEEEVEAEEPAPEEE